MEGEFSIEFEGQVPDEEWERLWKIIDQAIPYTKEFNGADLVVVPCNLVAGKNTLIQLKEGDDWLNVGFTTPIDLIPNDLCLIKTTTGELLAVQREGDVIYAR